MRHRLVSFCLLIGMLVPTATLLASGADADKENDLWITRNAIVTEEGIIVPAGAFGIVDIDRPRQGTLLDLRGVAGQGDIVLRSDEAGYCLSLRVRLVAGDFGGDTISAGRTEPIRLVIKSRRVAKALSRGTDIVSEDFRVSHDDHQKTEILVVSGLEESFGFILNPGRNLWDELWGPELTRIPCSRVGE